VSEGETSGGVSWQAFWGWSGKKHEAKKSFNIEALSADETLLVPSDSSRGTLGVKVDSQW